MTKKTKTSKTPGTSKTTAPPHLPVVAVNEQAASRPKLSKLERMARREKSQSIRVASFAGNFGNSGSGSIANADSSFYSPQLSTDFLELPQSEREKRELFRFWYSTHPIVGSAIDFHTDVPMSKIRLSLPKGADKTKNRNILHFYERMCKRIRLFQTLYDATHEYWLHGNCHDLKTTFISTDCGSIIMGDIEPGNNVLTHKGRYRPVTKLSRRISDHINEIEISCIPFNLRVTDEHPIETLVDGVSNWVFASSIKSGDFVRSNYISEIEDIESVNILNDHCEKFENGYVHKILRKLHRQPNAHSCRVSFLTWLSHIDGPTVVSREALAKKFNVKLHTFHNVILQLQSEISEPFHRRVGHGKFGGGSAVEWMPVSISSHMFDPTYENEQSYFFETPTNIPVNSDLLYLIGYWLGDGTQTHVTKDGSRHRHFWRLVFGSGSEKQAEKCRGILDRLIGSRYIHEVVDNRGLLTMYIGSHPAWIDWWKNNFGETSHGNEKKRIPQWVMKLPLEKQMHLVAGLFDSDGCLSQNGDIKCTIGMTSRPVIDSLREILLRCGIISSYHFQEAREVKIFDNDYLSDQRPVYTINIFRESFCRKIESFCVKQFPIDSNKLDRVGNSYEFIDNSLWLKVNSVKRELGVFEVGNFEVAEDHTYQANYVSTHNCFIFCEDHDLTSDIPEEMFLEPLTDGEVREETEVDYAGRTTTKKERKRSLKPESDRDKTIRKYVADNYTGWERLQILPPEQVKLEVFQYTNKTMIELIPSEKDKLLVMKASEQHDEESARIAEDIPDQIREQLLSGKPIPLNSSPYDAFLCSSFCYHLSHKKSAYDDRGISLLERCLRTLLFQDKLRQAQTSIASRAMTPKRIIWADKMSEPDVEALRDQIDQAIVDPDFTVVTNFEVHWDEIGSRDRLLDLGTEYEITNKLLFIGLRITESMLTGESSYSGERIHLDVMNTMYLLYRENIVQFVEEQLFEPVAEKKGFFEFDESGNKIYLYPKLQFTRLALRDNSELQDYMFNLYQKGSLPISFILELLNIDSDETLEQLKKDMFTPNDSTFNEFLKGLLQKAADKAVDETNVVEILTKNSGLKMIKKNDRFSKDE